MSKNTRSAAFRKVCSIREEERVYFLSLQVDVDELDDEKYQDEDVAVEEPDSFSKRCVKILKGS